jgi:uncharacterized protein (DUF1919 family)
MVFFHLNLFNLTKNGMQTIASFCIGNVLLRNLLYKFCPPIPLLFLAHLLAQQSSKVRFHSVLSMDT